MKRIGCVLFVIFYISATVNVAGERSARAVYRLEHSSKPAAREVSPPLQHFNEALPNFGHAKKVKQAVVDVSLELSSIQIVVRQFEDVPDAEYSPSDNGEVHSSRAPPTLI
jgi:hypothetical protein